MRSCARRWSVEPVEPLELKGKAEPVPAFRLVAVLDAPERSHASRFVGRERELALIATAWERAQARVALRAGDGRGRGGGGQVAARGRGARRDRGARRARSLPALRGGDHVLAGRRGREAAGELPSDPVAAAAIRSLLGESDVGTSGGRDRLGVPEAARGAGAARGRASTTSSGARRPSSTWSSRRRCSRAGAPLLLLCMARPELLERRPAWPATLRLEPLAAGAGRRLIGDEVVRRAARADRPTRPAATRSSSPRCSRWPPSDAEVEVPPTLKALLAARLDQLDEPSAGCSSAARSRARSSTAAPSRRSARRRRR